MSSRVERLMTHTRERRCHVSSAHLARPSLCCVCVCAQRCPCSRRRAACGLHRLISAPRRAPRPRSMERLQRIFSSVGGGAAAGPQGDSKQVDTAEQVYISSLALLKMLKHGAWRRSAQRARQSARQP